MPASTAPGSNSHNMFDDLMSIDDSMGNDYIEEKMDADGHTLRKEVHKGDGWTTVEITGDISSL